MEELYAACDAQYCLRATNHSGWSTWSRALRHAGGAARHGGSGGDPRGAGGGCVALTSAGGDRAGIREALQAGRRGTDLVARHGLSVAAHVRSLLALFPREDGAEG